VSSVHVLFVINGNNILLLTLWIIYPRIFCFLNVSLSDSFWYLWVLKLLEIIIILSLNSQATLQGCLRSHHALIWEDSHCTFTETDAQDP
jgi:hypothetical protein